jgi:hypothetical protein
LLSGMNPTGRFRNVFTGETHVPDERQGMLGLAVSDVLGYFPVALLVGEA